MRLMLPVMIVLSGIFSNSVAGLNDRPVTEEDVSVSVRMSVDEI